MKESMIVDEYLKMNGCSRHKVTKVSGLPETTLRQKVNKNTISVLTISDLRSIGMAIGKDSWSVLRELEDLELVKDDLLGFRQLLDKYQVRFPELEAELRSYIQELNDKGTKVKKFTFDQFNDIQPADIKSEIETALNNALDTLEELVEGMDNSNGE